MKFRLFVFTAILAVALALASCKKEENAANDNSTASTTNTSATDTSMTTATSATDTSSTGATGGGASTLADSEKDFIMKAAQGGMAEVSSGSLAAQQGTDAGVKAFGNRMVTDHGKANDELRQLATNKGLALPAETDADHKKKQDELAKKTGKDFDKAYMEDMVKDHEHDVAEFEKMSKDAKDPDLKAWVTKTLPTLQDHLKMARETAGKVK